MKHKSTERQRENEWLMKKVKEEFRKYNGNFGYRRITMEINRQYKKQYDEKRIRRFMIQMGLKSHIRRSNGYSTKTSYINMEENILNREFTAGKPNEK
ncbi:IS3 family transposase [Virgibacillus pantothenticus]|uniref:IS3 family transposase n=1 Tax=Virgibacillus pantothenticus TaxID=1473 RepID=UPI00111550A4|nr:IS3 family transposase [Virgibacillus pantothenticus]